MLKNIYQPYIFDNEFYLQMGKLEKLHRFNLFRMKFDIKNCTYAKNFKIEIIDGIFL